MDGHFIIETMRIKETTTEYELDEVGMFGYIFVGILLLIIAIGFLFCIYIIYSEYKLEKSIIYETKAHNGSCIRNGIWNECSYSDSSSISIVNVTSSQTCYINGNEVNCSKI